MNFNSHARVGRDGSPQSPAASSAPISTHTPAWGVTESWQGGFARINISTHTPAWGVTNDQDDNNAELSISTHTPAWGVTGGCIQPAEHPDDFNSHARVGRDAIADNYCLDREISTHTPAWGVTNG